MTKKVFREILKNKMDSMGLSQEVLAEKIGVSPAAMSRWRQGKSYPQPENRSRLANELGMSIEELGLGGKEIEQLDMIIDHITQIILSGDNDLPQKLRSVANYVEKILDLRRDPTSEAISSFNARIQPSSTEHEEVIARTVEGKEHRLSWLGPQDSYIDNVVSIETGNHIASWRYLRKDGQQHREPSDTDMHVHVRNGYTVFYDSPILLIRLHMVPSSTGARCVPE